jgi:hypothetical protein
VVVGKRRVVRGCYCVEKIWLGRDAELAGSGGKGKGGEVEVWLRVGVTLVRGDRGDDAWGLQAHACGSGCTDKRRKVVGGGSCDVRVRLEVDGERQKRESVSLASGLLSSPA